jgi:hypothetical protein
VRLEIVLVGFPSGRPDFDVGDKGMKTIALERLERHTTQ